MEERKGNKLFLKKTVIGIGKYLSVSASVSASAVSALSLPVGIQEREEEEKKWKRRDVYLCVCL
jgi:hypothetical protein